MALWKTRVPFFSSSASLEVNPELRWTLWFLESEKPAAVSSLCTNVHKVLKIYLDITIL